MKRALQFSDWLTTEVLEKVTHQQYVLTIPKIIRPYFKYDRRLLGKLCLCAWETIKEFFAACLPKGTVPGAVIAIQTWGNRGANFHPHLHGLVSKGAFDAHGVFYPLPWIDTQKMALLFRDKVFSMLIHEGKITEDLARKIGEWPHSGFNIHNEVQIDTDDEKGKENLAQYIVKAPISQERMIYDKENQKVIYKSRHGTIVYEPLDWLAAITSHIPNKYSQTVHFYGSYSNKSRGLRIKAQEKFRANDTISSVTPPPKKACSKKWAELIKLIYEVNPLRCPKCQHEMRIVAIINDPLVVEKILKHLDLWRPQVHSPPVNKETRIVEEVIYDYSFFDYLPM